MAYNSTATLFFFLLPVLFLCVTSQQKHPTQINLGSSISPRSTRSSWSSPSGHFEFGFYHEGLGFKIGIWLVGTEQNTVVWTANRDDPPVTSNAILSLHQSGKLLLRTEHGQEKIIANTTYPAIYASMLDSGNFVLYNNHSHTIWESFKYPTDTILGDQLLSAGKELFSSLSDTDHSTGRFHLKMQLDGNLVLYPINTDDSSIDAYWSSETFGNGFEYHLSLNHTGLLAIVNTTSSEMVRSLSLGGGGSSSSENDQKVAIYRATIDFDGIFRLYSYGIDDKNNGKVKKAVMVWKALNNPCEVQGFCGINSFCAIFDDQPNCLCIPGSDFVDLNQKTLGCLRNYSDEECVYGRENTTFYTMEKMENIMWGDIAYMEASMSMEECENSCLEDCNCGAALFKQDEEDYERDLCLKQKLPLRYLRRDFDNSITTTAFIKVGKKEGTKTINGTNSVPTELVLPGTTQQVITSKIVLIQILVLVIAFVIFSFVSLAISGLYIFKIRILRYKRLGEINRQMGWTGDDELIALRVFSYNELKKATDGFKDELGKGSFGAVYKGVLNRGRRLVAVKRLEKLIEEGEREFRAEMRAIGRTNHKNLVRLMGYCAEDSKRLLVYEYMSNRSLADLLFKQAKRPDWNKRVRISIDVAKGLHYLHEQCRTPIIHCDVKPQNILMDDFWNPKISDFGLAKLLMPDQTRTFTGIRGTRGYLAPEWEKNTPISVKADVYSYGIVLLEIICCRRNLEMNVPTIDEIVLSCWIYKCFASRQLHKLEVGEDADKETLEKMVKVGLWCIQDEPVLRPSMKSVILMLEGITDIASPPCPTSASI